MNIVSGFTIEVHYEVDPCLSEINLITTLTPKDLIYSPIDSQAGEFRVLVLQPGGFGTPLQCRLVTISISDPNQPKFEAVSYC